MDQQIPKQQSDNPQPVPPVQQPVAPHAAPLKNQRLLWILAGIFVLLIGIGIGMFLMHPSQNTQPVNQHIVPQTKVSITQVSPGTNVLYPTVSMNALPLGDNKYTTNGPKKGFIYLCRVMKGNGGAQVSGNWITGTTWTTQGKPSVQGAISWPNATFSDKVSGSNRIISGNGLPVGMTTGTFPIASSDPAYQYDRNPNAIHPQTISLTLPVNPTVLTTPGCMGGEVGIMNNGVPIFNGFDEEMRDAAAHEIQDSCDGHPQISGEYHYHSLSRCFKDIRESTVLGFALDGFPITGPVQSNGKYLTTEALDVCHGTTSTIQLDGKEVSMYHYVMTEDFPYSVSCFKGKPVSLQVVKFNSMDGQAGFSGSQQGQGQGNNTFGPPPGGKNGQGQMPPPPGNQPF
jgi:YHYH protein